MLPEGLTGRIAYTPDVSGSSNNDKTSSGLSTAQGSAYDLTLVASDAVTGMSGLTIGAGYGKTKSVTSQNSDLKDETYYATYAVGGFTLGYQMSEADLGRSTNEQKYENDGYGITFNVNDDLSVGYNHYESKQTSTTNVTAEASSIQVAYSAGGASVRIMRATADNMDYSTAVNQDRDNTVVSVALAF
jgi:hypothetical protein